MGDENLQSENLEKVTDPNRSAEAKVGTWVGEVERPANVAGETSGRIGRLHGLQVGGGAVAATTGPD